MIFGAFLVLTILLVILTLLPRWRFKAWWVRALDFPRLQLFVIALLLLIIGSVTLDLSHLSTWGLLVTLLLCLGYHTWWIIPYTRLFPVEVVSANNSDNKQMIRILASNVLTPNRNAQGLINLVRENKPDVLVTLESDAWWQAKLDTLEDYLYTIKCPLDNLYGMHVYSRLPLTDSYIDYLVEPHIPSIHTLITLRSGHKVRAHFVHPTPPSPTENEDSSEHRDAELIVVAKRVAESEMPVIVAGDLNDVAWSETTRLFRKISGLLDPRVGRGMFNTFHAEHWFLRWPLDHLFHSDHFTLGSMRKLQKIGSDHFPLLTELVFDAGRKFQQNGLDADAEDLARAKATAESQQVSKNDVSQPGKI